MVVYSGLEFLHHIQTLILWKLQARIKMEKAFPQFLAANQ